MASEGGTARRRNVHSSNSRGVQGSDETQHPAPSRTQSDGFEYVDQGEFGDAAFQSYFQDAELEEAPSGMKRSRSIEKLTKMLTDVMREEVHRSVRRILQYASVHALFLSSYVKCCRSALWMTLSTPSSNALIGASCFVFGVRTVTEIMRGAVFSLLLYASDLFIAAQRASRAP